MLGVKFEVRPLSGVDESFQADLPPREVPLHIARKKSAAAMELIADDELVITADTVVIVGGKVLGKPSDPEEARLMLGELSGKTHTVVTGVSVCGAGRQETAAAFTDVTFAALTYEEIDFYIERYRPFDKAGAYGIQEWIGCVGVRNIDGSFYNVMGLPLHLLYTLLRRF